MEEKNEVLAPEKVTEVIDATETEDIIEAFDESGNNKVVLAVVGVAAAIAGGVVLAKKLWKKHIAKKEEMLEEDIDADDEEDIDADDEEPPFNEKDTKKK